MATDLNLTPQQSANLEQFTEITNWSEGPEAAVRLLESTAWNLETALALHFESLSQPAQTESSAGPSHGSPSRVSSRQSRRQPEAIALVDEITASLQESQKNLAPRVNSQPSVYSSNPSIITTVLFGPFSLGFKLINSALYFLSWMFPFLPRITGYYPANRHATHSETRHDPKSVAIRFATNFAEAYGTNDLKWFEGSYTQALDLAKKDLKFLVVVLLSEEHDATAKFSKNVLLDKAVTAVLSRPNVILWGGDVRQSEAFQVANGLDCVCYPFVALIAPTPKSATSTAVVMAVLSRLQGEVDAQTVASTFEEKMEAHAPKLLPIVLEQQEREAARRIRQEQDSAYERSLEADRVREQQAREARERAAREEEAEKRRVEEERKQEETRKTNLAQWKKWRAYQLANTKLAEGDKGARILIRTADGKRLVHIFGSEQTIDDIYAYVECQEFLESGATAGDAAPPQPPKGYQHSYDFELVSILPRKVIALSNQKICEESAIFPTGSLLVEAL